MFSLFIWEPREEQCCSLKLYDRKSEKYKIKTNVHRWQRRTDMTWSYMKHWTLLLWSSYSALQSGRRHWHKNMSYTKQNIFPGPSSDTFLIPRQYNHFYPHTFTSLPQNLALTTCLFHLKVVAKTGFVPVQEGLRSNICARPHSENVFGFKIIKNLVKYLSFYVVAWGWTLLFFWILHGLKMCPQSPKEQSLHFYQIEK